VDNATEALACARRIFQKMNDSGIALHEDGRFDMRNPGLRLLLLLLFLLIGGQPTARAYQPDGSADEVVLTEKVFRHIRERHWPDSTAPGAGKFQYGITEDGLRALINQAVQSGHSRVNTNGRPGVIYEYDFQRQIGTNIDGRPATRLRVVVNRRNQVVTAFPF
jgi:hypothetical protein